MAGVEGPKEVTAAPKRHTRPASQPYRLPRHPLEAVQNLVAARNLVAAHNLMTTQNLVAARNLIATHDRQYATWWLPTTW